MDERAVFERFHEALELEPQPGAYERFRAAFITAPAAAKPRRPVFRMRFSKMGLRVAAALAVVAIAIAVGAAILTTHNRPTGELSASQQKNIKAYNALMLQDYDSFSNATSNHCNTIDDQGCAAAIAHLTPAIQKWIDDLAAFKTPAQYVVLDGRLRAHLAYVIGVLANSAVGAQQRKDVAGFNLAMNAALYERAWIDPAAQTLWGIDSGAPSYQVTAGQVNRSLRGCANGAPAPEALGCTHIAGAEECLGAAAQACADDIQSAETQLENYFVAFAQHPAPAGNKDSVQPALVEADNALLDLLKAQLSGDASKVTTAELRYAAAIDNAVTFSGLVGA